MPTSPPDPPAAFLRDFLDDSLAERIRPGAVPPRTGGEFVLYWMHHGLRGHENPALDVAIAAARRYALPLLVYQGLSERYAFASDRHHAFQLQGAIDVHAELQGRNIRSIFHLERPGHRGPHLRSLAQRAAIVVTEEFPTEPIVGWSRRLAAQVETPVWHVDASCIVPMPLVPRAHDRAFAFRDATRKLRKDRLTRVYVEQPDPSESFEVGDLPFEPIDLTAAGHPGNPAMLRDLVAACDIDHGVSPIPHTRGGSRAGYARWNAFRAQGLRRYADHRNDALRDGVSRMSAYLHYGMVSPFRLAREAAETGGDGAEKYLDELLIWRELAYCFCYHRDDHGQLSALPEWAVDTLRDHEGDARPALLDAETLARGATGEPLWDAAQRSLLMQGELHNNVRMTWGKALLAWTRDAAEALELLIDLNHRYALDGRDPASYGGLLWCLGQFDRPHTPPQPILGMVRSRPAAQHAERLDVDRYRARVTRPWHEPSPRVAVLGAGLAGLMAARTLQDHGLQVNVFEKSRGLGGRMATRRVDPGMGFDHGAQYFTVRDPHFARSVAAWERQGLVAEWLGTIVRVDAPAAVGDAPRVTPGQGGTRRFVGTPGMTSIARHLARDLAIRLETRIVAAHRDTAGWSLVDDQARTHGPFDYLVSTIPAPQAFELLRDHPLAANASRTPMTPCWTVMAAFTEPVAVEWDGAFVHGSPLGWVARNSSKPGRVAQPESWVVQAGPEWSNAQRDREKTQVVAEMLAEFARITGGALPTTVHVDAHRWLYAASPTAGEEQAIFDRDTGLALGGDWLAGGRVEGAFRSGVAAAGYLLREVAMP